MKRTMRVFFPCLWRRNLPCFSSHAVVGGGHPRAGDRCGWAVGHAEWRRAGSQGQGRYRLSNTYDKISHSVNRYSFFYLFLYRIYWLTVLNPLRWAVLFIHPVLLFHFNCLWSPLCLFLSHCRTLSQSCWTRSEGCRSSPPLKRNDGTGIPAFLPPLWSSTPPLVFLPHLMFFSSNWWPALLLPFKPVVFGNDPADFVDQYEGRGGVCTIFWLYSPPVIWGICYVGAFRKAVIFGCMCIFWKICTVLFGEEKQTTENNVGSIFSLT